MKTRLALLVLILTFPLNPLAAPNSIIAIVNQEVITLNDINDDIEPNFTQAEKITVLNKKIDLLLQLGKIKEFGIQPKPKTIQTRLSNIASQNGLTDKQLRSLPEFNTIVENIQRQLSLVGLKQVILQEANIQLTQAEIQTILKKHSSSSNPLNQQVKIAKIVINSIDQSGNLSTSKDELAKQFLTKLSAEINQGAAFSNLAKRHSQDPSYKNGGVSKWLDKSKLLTTFKPLAKLKLGELSAPFQTQQGWLIGKIIDERSIDTELIKLKSQRLRAKQDDYYKNWIKELRKNTYVEVFDHKLGV